MLLLTVSIFGCVRISDADLAARLAMAEVDDSGDPCTTAWWYLDEDGDGYGNPAAGEELCEGPSGYVTNDADCDDTDSTINPTTTWYLDSDGDGYGDGEVVYISCETPSGYTGDQTDCNDLDETSFPGGVEVCDGEDNDCDGLPDNDAVDAIMFYADSDGDGYGDETAGVILCEAPSGTVKVAGDCDDTDMSISPDAEEVCDDGVDNNCDDSANDCARSGASSLADADGSLWGEVRYDYAGQSMDAGDLTGDGKAELIISAALADFGGNRSGSVYLMSGPVSGQDALSNASIRIDGETDNDRLGTSVAAAGDVDGDGMADLLLGAPMFDSADENEGRTYLFTGPLSGTISAGSAAGTVDGLIREDRLGTAVAAPGDVDGDGLADLLLGAYGDDTGGNSAGAAFLVLGPATGATTIDNAHAAFWGESSSDRAGFAVSTVGDVDGDGLADLFIAADRNGSGSAGAAYVVLGGVSGGMSLSDADWILRGESDNDEAGAALGEAGDMDGDGLADLLIGGLGSEQAGVAWLVPGAGLGSATLADATARIDDVSIKAKDETLKVSLRGAGDVDGDGQGDLLIGGTASGGSGVVWLFYGPVSGTLSSADADASFTGEAQDDQAGYALVAPGDLSGDGLADFLISAPSADSTDTKAGKVYFILGAGL